MMIDRTRPRAGIRTSFPRPTGAVRRPRRLPFSQPPILPFNSLSASTFILPIPNIFRTLSNHARLPPPPRSRLVQNQTHSRRRPPTARHPPRPPFHHRPPPAAHAPVVPRLPRQRSPHHPPL